MLHTLPPVWPQSVRHLPSCHPDPSTLSRPEDEWKVEAA
jgi:hypothetical protein